MSTATDNAQNNGVIDLGDGVKATPNGDGTYTVSGATGDNADFNGVWEQSSSSNPGAILIDNTGTQFDGQYWVKK